MLVYGDPQSDNLWPALTARLWERFAQTTSSAVPSLDDLRTLLIQTGQWEQAASDAALPDLAPIEAVTNQAARAFYAAWAGQGGKVRDALDGMAQGLESLAVPDAAVSVKLPEGFAFYALYPEQYCAAARLWMAAYEQSRAEPVIVIGIRSIGTTLSAVVRAALAAEGWEARRFTVRPSGHPWARAADLPPVNLASAFALVTDEGPGLSGSSFAAVADALTKRGLDPARISFLPGHGALPGEMGSDAVRAVWQRTPRFVVPLADLRWSRQSLPERLVTETRTLLGKSAQDAQIEDLSGGLWRQFVYDDSAFWPAVCAPFERPKYRVSLTNGASVLWKFAGIQTEQLLSALKQRAKAGWTPEPLVSAFGFVALPWIDGTPLTVADGADPDILALVGHYLAQAAGPPLSSEEQVTSFHRLREMLYWNVWESLGEDAAETMKLRGEAILPLTDARAYGDGHLAPHEWLRTPDGRIWKTDSAGHDADHTVIGRQPLAWDVAGAWVEWELDNARAQRLLKAFQDAGGSEIKAATLTFYRMAYTAFRVGQTSLCAGMAAQDPDEQARLWQAYGRYKAELARLMEEPHPVRIAP